ncbi:hypothetical protein [Aquabacter spiritensis]|uniref:Uncharacterized protein n=1 Tax=Aquabacter spiritensis TaxID=933073 RepID=A0A4R3LTH7_9HYPH|nr:hypothetical protein [Aquabacter spiritensis]TCT03196.1 hypothetical protein EDC64_11059 [Aquabacter spiritensis]
MRKKASLLCASALLLLSGAAAAETRIFLLENWDGYGVDACLAKGLPCGEQLASSWCRAHGYAIALDFGQVSPETTGSIRPVASGTPSAPACTGRACPATVAISCHR